MNTKSQVVTMEKAFLLCGVDYKSLSQNTKVNVEEKNIKIKSYNHVKGCIEYKQIINLVRKEDREMYELKANNNTFKATPEHKVYTKEHGYLEIKDILGKEVNVLLNDNKFYLLHIKKLEDTFPVLDITVEGNENYFSNNILSHNSPEKIGIGESMKFYASVRIKTKKKDVEKDEEFGQQKLKVVMDLFKNKVGSPFKKAEFTLLTGENGQYGMDVTQEILDYAIKFELIKKAGTWYSYGEERIGQGSKSAKKFLIDNPVIYEEIKNKIIQSLREDKEESVYNDSFNSVVNTDSEKVEEAKEKVEEVKRKRKIKEEEKNDIEKE